MLGSYSPANAIAFFILVLVALIIDLRAHRQDKPTPIKSAAWWSLFWIVLALAFGGYIALTHGGSDASLYLTGYLLEKTLSVDNLFVIMAIFANFGIPDRFQHRVLYFGILGALVFRLMFVTLGTALLAAFGTWALLAFGLFVLWSAWKMGQAVARGHQEIADYADHWSVRAARRVMPVHGQLDGHNFLTKVDGRRMATPLLLCLIAIELADVMFAFDSVPAIFAITQEPFLVYTSNIFAILGLRSLYFLLAAARTWLYHLDKAVVAILAFIGVKMLIDVAGLFHVPPLVNLGVVLGLLAGGVIASLVRPDRRNRDKHPPPEREHFQREEVIMKLGQAMCGLAVALLAWCGGAAAAEPANARTVLVYGDSNVWGWTPGTMAERYPAQTRWSGRLADSLGEGWVVVENGLNGRTTDLNQPPDSDNALQNGLAALPAALSANAPLDLVVIALGVNDFQAANGRDARATAQAAARLIAAVQDEGWRSFPLGAGHAPQILVLAPSGFDAAKGGPFADMYAGAVDKLKQLPPLLREKAELAGVDFLDLGAAAPQAGGADGLHYTPEDHARVAEAVARKIRDMTR